MNLFGWIDLLFPCRRVSPGERIETEVSVRPFRSGATTVVATFNANELYNLAGTKKVTVVG